MAFSQISTSVTIINSGLIGYMGISLTNFNTSALSAIASGSGIEIAGAFFKCDGDLTINASSWTAITTATTAYLALTPSGTAGSQIITATWEATTPVWSTSKQGWYSSAGSNIRHVASAYKVSNTSQETKTIYNKGSDNIFIKIIPIGDWDMDAASNVEAPVYCENAYSFEVFIIHDTNGTRSPISIAPAVAGTPCWGFLRYDQNLRTLSIYRTASVGFDSTDYDATSFNRGHIIMTYQG